MNQMIPEIWRLYYFFTEASTPVTGGPFDGAGVTTGYPWGGPHGAGPEIMLEKLESSRGSVIPRGTPIGRLAATWGACTGI